jgi:hypothetical protein
LPSGRSIAIIYGTMERWSWHRMRILVLALLLGVGISLAFVEGSVMAAQMALSADGAHHGPSGCDACGGGDEEGAGAGTCLSVCGSAAQGLPPADGAALPSAFRTGFQAGDLLISGQSNSPDHGPPRMGEMDDMGDMMEHCNAMMQGTDDQRPNDQWRAPPPEQPGQRPG